MEKHFFETNEFWSLVKRKQFMEVLSIAFVNEGFHDAAEIAKTTTRLTDAAMKRMREAIEKERSLDTAIDEALENTEEILDAETEVDESDKAIDTTELDYEEEPRITVADIKALVEEGSKKSLKAAKKALKAQFDKSHPEYKGLKKLIKKAGK